MPNSSSELCEQCGHNDDAHLLHVDLVTTKSVDGLIGCPVDGCSCSGTWAMSRRDYDVAVAMGLFGE